MFPFRQRWRIDLIYGFWQCVGNNCVSEECSRCWGYLVRSETRWKQRFSIVEYLFFYLKLKEGRVDDMNKEGYRLAVYIGLVWSDLWLGADEVACPSFRWCEPGTAGRCGTLYHGSCKSERWEESTLITDMCKLSIVLIALRWDGRYYFYVSSNFSSPNICLNQHSV